MFIDVLSYLATERRRLASELNHIHNEKEGSKPFGRFSKNTRGNFETNLSMPPSARALLNRLVGISEKEENEFYAGATLSIKGKIRQPEKRVLNRITDFIHVNHEMIENAEGLVEVDPKSIYINLQEDSIEPTENLSKRGDI